MEINVLLGEAYKDGMTAEEIVEAIKAAPALKDQSKEIESLKETISKVNSECADWKKKYRDTLDESTRKQQEAEEKAKETADKLAKLEREKVVAGYKASYLAMGYDEALAEDTANALAEGNDAKLFENQRKHMESVEKKAREDALRGSGRPGGSGDGSSGVESEAVKLAKSIGKERAEIDANVKKGMEQFFK